MYSKKKCPLFLTACILSFLIFSFYYSGERTFFLKRMFEQPYRVGSIAPSSKSLAKLMAKEVISVIKQTNGLVVEIGPGTGSITRVLLEHNVAVERLICVEIDPVLHQYMTEHFPEVQTILGDAAALDTILSGRCGKIAAVVSGVPLKNLPLGKEEAIIQACCSVLKPSGKFIQ